MNVLKVAVGFIGVVLILSVLGIILLASRGNAIPDVLQNIAVGSLTGLVGLLVPSRSEPRA